METVVVGIRHVGIVVKNLERAQWFYQELLGLEVHRRMVERGRSIDNLLALENVEVETVKLRARDGNTQIELLAFRSHKVAAPEGLRMLTVGPTHVAFTVEALKGLYARMKDLGVVFNCPPVASPDGKVLLTYCRDPDGTLVELVEVL